ncbi:hypothetical protein [Rhodococcus sp. USK13]|uniref:hypothetical protein n=1 Tax=Rhodococcus sp. USK13 TaxID=2806442 RepID=UPI001BCD8C4F|nr:hypothetical protein [Rhodococcus sp. USK13]
MSMFWMVEVLAATLVVVAVSFAAAVTADTVCRRSRIQVLEVDDRAASERESRMRTVETSRRDRDWHKAAIWAWTIWVATSAIAVAFVGVLIIVG